MIPTVIQGHHAAADALETDVSPDLQKLASEQGPPPLLRPGVVSKAGSIFLSSGGAPIAGGQPSSHPPKAVAPPPFERPRPANWKTVLCTNFPDCWRGDGCPFAHGEEDLRVSLKPCLSYQNGFCSEGDRCLFLHVDHPPAPAGRWDYNKGGKKGYNSRGSGGGRWERDEDRFDHARSGGREEDGGGPPRGAGDLQTRSTRNSSSGWDVRPGEDRFGGGRDRRAGERGGGSSPRRVYDKFSRGGGRESTPRASSRHDPAHEPPAPTFSEEPTLSGPGGILSDHFEQPPAPPHQGGPPPLWGGGPPFNFSPHQGGPPADLPPPPSSPTAPPPPFPIVPQFGAMGALGNMLAVNQQQLLGPLGTPLFGGSGGGLLVPPPTNNMPFFPPSTTGMMTNMMGGTTTGVPNMLAGGDFLPAGVVLAPSGGPGAAPFEITNPRDKDFRNQWCNNEELPPPPPAAPPPPADGGGDEDKEELLLSSKDHKKSQAEENRPPEDIKGPSTKGLPKLAPRKGRGGDREDQDAIDDSDLSDMDIVDKDDI